MECLNCKSDNLYPSAILSIEERRDILKDTTCFMLCRSCGNVMMQKSNDKIVGTDEIKDPKIIKLAYEKLFEQTAFKGTAPSMYGYTKQGERFSVNKLNETALEETPVLDEPIDRDQLDQYYEESKSVDNETKETYPHVENSNPPVTFIGKVKRFIKNLFIKAS